MGLCSSSKDGAIKSDGLHHDNANSNSTNSLRVKNTGQTSRNLDLYRTASDVRQSPRESIKLGFAVPQSLLQHENQGEQKRMEDATRKEILGAFN